MKSWANRRSWVMACVAMATAILTACSGSTPSGEATPSTSPSGRPGEGKPPVMIGTKSFTEQFILGNLYAQALEAKGYTIHLKTGLGPTESIDKALTSGRIDLYPEYTGVITEVVAPLATLTAPGAPANIYVPPSTAEEAFRQAADFQKARGFTLLDMAPFENGVRLAVTPAFAEEHHLASMADLDALPSFRFGAPAELEDRYEGLRGLKQIYQLRNVEFVPLPIGDQYAALDNGSVETAAVLLTDGRLTEQKVVILTDPKKLFGFQNVAPVVNSKKLTQLGPEFAETLNLLSAKLTADAMQTMNAEVDLRHKDPASVAHEFLVANGMA